MKNIDEEKLMRIFKRIGRPIGTDSLFILSGMPRRDLHDKLESMRKFKKIRKVTSQRVDFWDFE